ncbi:MAG: 2-isopropylmalate synthase [Treponema sp. CETP13]|nr:MAG: 2-isopropylmalate synthase [Treponema sp. CETP13]
MAKYVPFGKINIQNREWPDKVIEKAPLWVSVDLRDGNQSLPKPMGVEQKLEFFDLLVATGFKEIEVGFPSASETEYTFLRRLIEEKRIPDDVTIQVLCQAREKLVKKTFECLQGCKKAIFHIYNSTSPAQRKYTFNMTKEEIIKVAVDGVECVKKAMSSLKGTDLRLEYSPESFSSTEIEYAVEICNAVEAAWNPTPENKIIFNLPTTIECATPNIHADQIEYFCKHINNRDSVIVSLHNHNDRGTGVACAELALLAGAERVEGTLFGNGERTGNLDIITTAMNMYVQGVDPKLDFSNLPSLTDAYKRLTDMPVNPRHPYVGELVFTAFSGSHQDAIRKGMKARKEMMKQAQKNGSKDPNNDVTWDVPYLPLDPHDVGREYEEIIRVNSQSGKGGAAWILEENYGIFCPKAMHPVLGEVVTAEADHLQRELTAAEIYSIFNKQWMLKKEPLSLLDLAETHVEGPADNESVLCRTSVSFKGKTYNLGAKGNGPLAAFVAALRTSDMQLPSFSITSFHEHSIGTGSDTDAMGYVELTFETGKKVWGAGRSSNVGRAGINAVISAINQL